MSDRLSYQTLGQELAERLSVPAVRCLGEDCRDLKRTDIVRVKSHDVRTAHLCQSKAAAPSQDFEPDIFKTTRTVALRSVSKLRRSPTVLAAVTTTMKAAQRQPVPGEMVSDDWLNSYLQSVGFDVRLAIAARANTWLAETLDALGVADHRDSARWQNGSAFTLSWTFPGRGLKLEASVDLALPDAGNFVPVVVVRQSPEAKAVAAYNTLLWTISRRKEPNRVLLVDQAASTTTEMNPRDLYELGLQAALLATNAVTQRPLAAHESQPLELERRPSLRICADCGWQSSCPEALPTQVYPQPVDLAAPQSE